MLTPCSSEAEGDQTERVISERVPASEGAARAPGMSEPRAADFRLQEPDFSKQPKKFPTQKLFAATDSPPRVCRHGCRRTVRSRSRGRRPAKKQMRQEVEFRLKSAVVRPLGRTGQARPVARRRRSVMKCGFALSEPIAHHLSAVPPAVQGSEVAVAAPIEVHALMDLG